MIINDSVIKNAHDFLDKHRKKAFKNIILISNNSFDKNPFLRNSSIVNDLLLEKFNLLKVILRCLLIPLYFVKNLVIYFNVLLVYLLQKFNSKRYKEQINDSEIVIDTFSTNYMDPFDDKYFLNLYNELNVNNIKYCVLLKESYKKNPFKFYKGINSAIYSKHSTIIDILELNLFDFFKVFISIFSLPFYSLIYALKNLRLNKRDIYFSFHLISSLSNADFLPYLRYLFSLKFFAKSQKKIIMVCEFQNKDLFLIKGIRKTKHNHVIHATQFFFKPKNILKFHLTENDKKIGIYPDFVHVICNQYCIDKNYVSGPALRYQHLFQEVKNKKINDILIVLPYFVDDVIYVLNFLNECHFLHNRNIPIKFHPDTLFISKKKNNIVSKFKLIHELDKKEFFKTIISTGTGLMVEKIIKGSKVFIIEKNKGITTNPIPDNISKMHWELVKSPVELENKINYTLKNQNFQFEKINLNIIKKVKSSRILSYFNLK